MEFRLMRISVASLLFVFFSMPVNAELVLSSPAIDHGGNLPADLKCTRDGGDGLSPPISWGWRSGRDRELCRDHASLSPGQG